MNRPLKFRVWNKSRNDWLNDSPGTHCFSEYYLDLEGGGLVRFDGSYTDHEERYSRARQEDWYIKGTEIIKESPYVITQFTGLLDKNSTEIYEGDIVKYKHPNFLSLQIGFIVFDKAQFLIKNTVMQEYKHLEYLDLSYFSDKAEVIGNIFQNKELL